MEPRKKAEGTGDPKPGNEEVGPLVEVGGARRPFMRGIMVHSLMARGVSFDEAYRTAEEVRERVRGHGVVRPSELARLITDILGEKALADHGPPASLPASIQVTTRKRSTPFSKGTLSQSLLAAALDLGDAFDVAREIELELVRRGQREIARADLRTLAYETLLSRFGQRTGELYLTWRRFQEPEEKPVIILLGGTTGAGKTSVALEVARRLGIRRVLSTDSIRQVMRIMLSPELMPAIHASSFDAWRYLPGVEADDRELAGFTAQATAVAVGVRAMLGRAVAENASLVLDGVTLLPGLIDLDAYRDAAHVIYLVIATLDEEAFVHRFEERGDRETRRETHRYLQNLEAILKIQDHFLELAERHDVPIVDNVSIDSSVTLIIRHVVNTLRKEG
ncbi:MAG: zeta toxin family protein [Proteobacteria bacterium]|nr:zeta toxin family protein [Pseudomonadota bacterium]